jgi:hypothetical protein
MLAALAPDEPEVLGLQALLEIQGSRMAARLNEDGAPVLLEAQDRKRWDQLLIRRGMAALQQAELLAARGTPVGKYFLQASIAAQHARAQRAEDTNWRRIAALYDVLAAAAPGPVVEVNRAVAHGRAFGPNAGACRTEGARRRCARRLAARAECARRPARTGRAPRPGEQGIHRGGRPHQKRERGRSPAPSSRTEPDPSVEVGVSRPGVCGGPPTSLSLRSWTNRAAKRIEVDLDRVHLTGTGMCVRFDASNWRWSDAPLVRWLGSPRAALLGCRHGKVRRLAAVRVKAVVYDRYGSPDVLRVVDVPVPSPATGQVRVKVAATSVNLSDWEGLRGSPGYARIGGLRHPARRTLGSDIAGVVDEVGEGSPGLDRATRCMGTTAR